MPNDQKLQEAIENYSKEEDEQLDKDIEKTKSCIHEALNCFFIFFFKVTFKLKFCYLLEKNVHKHSEGTNCII